jgi:hypothetical protein
MKLDEFIKKVSLPKSRVEETLRKLNISETEFTDSHVKIFETIRVLRDNCTGDEHEKTEQAIAQYLAQNSGLAKVKMQAITTPEAINPELFELMDELATEISVNRTDGDLEEYVEGAIFKAYEGENTSSRELGAIHMSDLINQKVTERLNSPAFTKRAKDVFESVKKRVLENRK